MVALWWDLNKINHSSIKTNSYNCTIVGVLFVIYTAGIPLSPHFIWTDGLSELNRPVETKQTLGMGMIW